MVTDAERSRKYRQHRKVKAEESKVAQAEQWQEEGDDRPAAPDESQGASLPSPTPIRATDAAANILSPESAVKASVLETSPKPEQSNPVIYLAPAIQHAGCCQDLHEGRRREYGQEHEEHTSLGIYFEPVHGDLRHVFVSEIKA